MRGAVLILLLAGCGAQEQERGGRAANAQENAAAAPPAAVSAEDMALSAAAAEALRLYYDRIGRGDWRGAFAMREPAPGLTLERFAASFERYEDYRATVGTPSLPARQDGELWVQVPVQLYGRMVGGRPFGSVGAVMLKRARGGEAWRIVS
jgi:hypothetical protein